VGLAKPSKQWMKTNPVSRCVSSSSLRLAIIIPKPDITTKIEISTKNSFFGGKKEVEVEKQVTVHKPLVKITYNGNYSYGKAPKGQYRERTTEVGSFPPNAFGLSDMHGNVWEWCLDTWHENYNDAPSDGSSWVNKDNDYRVLRGGSWNSNADICRSAYRSRSTHNYHGQSGFRVVCILPPELF
jgi:formylglycine-generating enzyme required for sulfatase activity